MAALAALGDPLRRRLYRYVVAQDDAVGRDEAARAAGVARSVAAFHLDRLVDEGLLEAEFRRLGLRRGPGAGRPSKLYRRVPREIVLSLPPRQYDLAAQLLAATVSEAAGWGGPVAATLRRLAGERGAELARTAYARAGPESTPRARLEAALGVLADNGYEPRRTGGQVVLANCPFHSLVAHHAELVCGMSSALLGGLAAALPGVGMEPHPVPSGGGCCVRLGLTGP